MDLDGDIPMCDCYTEQAFCIHDQAIEYRWLATQYNRLHLDVLELLDYFAGKSPEAQITIRQWILEFLVANPDSQINGIMERAAEILGKTWP
jgi:hypothetical protein